VPPDRSAEGQGRGVAARSISAFAALADEAGEALPALLEASRADDQEGRAARGALTAVRKAPRSTAPALMKFLKDPEPHVRLKAIAVLCALEEYDKECLAALVELAKRRDPKIRLEACQLLYRYGSAASEAVPALGEIIRNETDSRTRLSAFPVLGRVKPAARKETIPALSEIVGNASDSGMRSTAAGMLGGMGPDAKAAIQTLKGAIAELAPLLKDDRQKGRFSQRQAKSLEASFKAALKKIEQ
jgi:HEAT repeat protein